MNTHFIFCCSMACVNDQMDKITVKNSEDLIVSEKANKKITVKRGGEGVEQFFFFCDINRHPESIYGYRISSFQVCGNYILDWKVKKYCESHLC